MIVNIQNMKNTVKNATQNFIIILQKKTNKLL
jgi:hypothetical protein